jgi:hypothetical protein
VSGGYFKSMDRSGITSGQRGVLYGLQISIQPNFDRNNAPYDDADCLVLHNEGTGQGTEALYMGHNSALTQGDFHACIGMDMWADRAIYMTGTYDWGIDLYNYGLFPATLNNGFLRCPVGTKIIVGRNVADTQDLDVMEYSSGGGLDTHVPFAVYNTLQTHSQGGKIGYGSSAGSTVTQTTNKTTAVQCDYVSGQITMNSAALGGGSAAAFTFNNTQILADDQVFVYVKSGYATANTYRVKSEGNAVGSRTVILENISGGSLSESVVIGFNVWRGSIS